MNFEDYLVKLNQSIESLEKPETTLSEGIEIFEEGVKNIAQCLKILNECKGKITVIKSELDELFADELS